jgi:hypothetical protein
MKSYSSICSFRPQKNIRMKYGLPGEGEKPSLHKIQHYQANQGDAGRLERLFRRQPLSSGMPVKKRKAAPNEGGRKKRKGCP